MFATCAAVIMTMRLIGGQALPATPRLLRSLTARAGRAALFVLVLGVATATAFSPVPAHADSQQNQSFSVWQQMQACAQQAFKQFPDYTKADKAKRENARQECLRQHRLPVPDPVYRPAR